MQPPAFPRTLLEFQRLFPDERACAAYLEQLRWSEGFACPFCGAVGEPYRFESRPTVLMCRSCRRQTTLTAGTAMHRSKQSLPTWFWAGYLVATHTPGMSALQFQRQLGIKTYETAFTMLHKLRAAMVRPDRDRIGGEWMVEVDEAYVGGRTRGEGRGVHHKTLVIGAVEVRPSKTTTKKGAPKGKGHGSRGFQAGRLRFKVIPERSAEELLGFVGDNVEPGTLVVTDGYERYDKLSELGYGHEAVTLAGDSELTDEALPMIHIVFGNLKAWLLGTHHGVSPKRLQAYLDEFVFRFNRRFYPMTSFRSVLGLAVRPPPGTVARANPQDVGGV